MSTPEPTPEAVAPSPLEGTDVRVDPADLEGDAPTPATSDPDQLSDGGALGGVGGQGGAG